MLLHFIKILYIVKCFLLQKNVFTKIQEQLKNEARILNIREKEEAIKFIVLPPKQSSTKCTSKNSNDSEESSKEDS